MIKKYLKWQVGVLIFFILGTLYVHLFDREFAGKLTMPDQTELIAKGKVLFQKKGCLSCHGEGGRNPADEKYPIIGGQSHFYNYQQIIDIRDGRRDNGGSSLMKGSIQRLKDDQAYLISLFLEQE